MKRILFLLFSSFVFTAFGQKDKEFGSDINNGKSTNAVNIAGTKIFVVLPGSLTLSESSSGIEKDGGRFITVAELHGTSFYDNTNKFTMAARTGDVFKMLNYKEFTINGLPAKLAVRQVASTITYSLAFGDSTFCVNITAFFEDGDRRTEKQLKKVINSIYYDKSQTIGTLPGAPFMLDESQSIFKFVEKKGNNYIYTVGGEKSVSYDDIPSLTIYFLHYAPQPLQSIIDRVINMLQYPDIKNISNSSVNGFTSFSREVYGQMQGKNYLLYQQVTVINQNTVVISGVATDNFDKYLAEFKKLAATITKK